MCARLRGCPRSKWNWAKVESFLPNHSTGVIRVSHAGYRMREVHDLLNRDGLAFTEYTSLTCRARDQRETGQE